MLRSIKSMHQNLFYNRLFIRYRQVNTKKVHARVIKINKPCLPVVNILLIFVVIYNKRLSGQIKRFNHFIEQTMCLLHSFRRLAKQFPAKRENFIRALSIIEISFPATDVSLFLNSFSRS